MSGQSAAARRRPRRFLARAGRCRHIARACRKRARAFERSARLATLPHGAHTRLCRTRHRYNRRQDKRTAKGLGSRARPELPRLHALPGVHRQERRHNRRGRGQRAYAQSAVCAVRYAHTRRRLGTHRQASYKQIIRAVSVGVPNVGEHRVESLSRRAWLLRPAARLSARDHAELRRHNKHGSGAGHTRSDSVQG